MGSLELANAALVASYSTIALYVMAFICFALDLAKRSGDVIRAKATDPAHRVAQLIAAAGPLTEVTIPATSASPVHPSRGRSVFYRVAFSLTILGFVLHVSSVALRGMAAGRVPWANMFEFGLTGTALIIGTFLLISRFIEVGFLGTYVLGLNLVLLGVAVVNCYVPVSPLQPSLQSYWLVVHVFVACLGTAFFALAAGLSAAQLIQEKRERSREPALPFMDTLPDAERLEDLAYRTAIVGFILWTLTLIAGAIWAERAWGRYWGWDTKETWTFIIWVLYAGYIHARATRGWRGTRSAALSLMGFSTVMFNFSVVNIFFNGLHSYSGL